MVNVLEHGLFGPHTSDLAAQFPLVVAVVATEVVVVAPVPVDEVEVLEVEVDEEGSGPSQLLEIRTSAQFQNCSGTPRPSGGKG